MGSDDNQSSIVRLPINFNPRSPCGERLVKLKRYRGSTFISIHAPRVGSDYSLTMRCLAGCAFQSTLPVWGATDCSRTTTKHVMISIHAPRVGSDLDDMVGKTVTIEFQSTLPVWGATLLAVKNGVFSNNFNPRSPCGERLSRSRVVICSGVFQSTLPVWGATGFELYAEIKFGISIHAPRVGSDKCVEAMAVERYDFNPRSPCGERQRV